MTTDKTAERIDHRYLELLVKRQTLTFETWVIKDKEEALRQRIAKRLARGKLVERAQAQRESLHNHRMNVVRPEARAAHLASCFLRGVPYANVEDPGHTRTLPDWDRVKSIVGTFSSLGANALKDGVETWRTADDWVKTQLGASEARIGTRRAKAATHNAESLVQRERRAEAAAS